MKLTGTSFVRHYGGVVMKREMGKGMRGEIDEWVLEGEKCEKKKKKLKKARDSPGKND